MDVERVALIEVPASDECFYITPHKSASVRHNFRGPRGCFLLVWPSPRFCSSARNGGIKGLLGEIPPSSTRMGL